MISDSVTHILSNYLPFICYSYNPPPRVYLELIGLLLSPWFYAGINQNEKQFVSARKTKILIHNKKIYFKNQRLCSSGYVSLCTEGIYLGISCTRRVLLFLEGFHTLTRQFRTICPNFVPVPGCGICLCRNTRGVL